MFVTELSSTSIPLYPLAAAVWSDFQKQLSNTELNWLAVHDFKAKAGQIGLIPNSSGQLQKVLVGLDTEEAQQWVLAHLPRKLPKADYHVVSDWSVEQQTLAAIGWGLGAYQFDTYLSKKAEANARLYVPVSLERVDAFVEAFSFVRDLINLPANAMMPEHLAAHTQQLAQQFNAEFYQIVGEDLVYENYPCIHAVGRASKHPPRLLELRWGQAQHPALTLVGKGVCFDSGGLDIKPSSFMRTMKKDMGGAAHVLGLAKLIMQLHLPVNLRVLIPAVENAVGGDAFRPGDILTSRAGKTIEVDNTDAEGRLVLCDALTEAARKNPELIIDFATLTGAARTALGTEIPVFFANNTNLIAQLQTASAQTEELIWNLPLHKPYFKQLKSEVADFTNSGGAYGGAITAALFLNEFVSADLPWAHFDIMAWNNRSRAGRPIGGEAMGLFATFNFLEKRYVA
jgi:leucyl aminopeptidase